MAQNLPTGANVVSGGVAISNPTAQSLAIQQSTPNAIVNWQGFSIGQDHAVNINQPSAQAAILNRVTSSAPSSIAGALNANGQVYLVNPNGIAITSSGTVKAAGFVASTLGISDADFLAGKRQFSGNGASAAVTNAGKITIGRGGYAALIGGTVENSGTISVPLGKVGLGSGEFATLDLSGDGFLQVAVPTKAGGKKALIKHSGTIRADGGRVDIQAATAREAARQAVNLSGIIEARTISGRTGAIVIGGGAGGGVRIGGRLDASAHAGVARGGRIAISGRKVKVSGSVLASGSFGGSINLASSRKAKVTGRLAAAGWDGTGGLVTVTGHILELQGALIQASGATGGGKVRIGGDAKGAGSLPRAGTASLDAATRVEADATRRGDGGSIVVWSNESTKASGTLTARGGPLGGNGGLVETSGGTIDFAGATIDTTAPRGKAGTWLVDPTDLRVDSTAATTISANLASTNVTLQTTATDALGPGVKTPGEGDITTAAPISWSSPLTLTLESYHAIRIDAPITIEGAGKLTLAAALDPTLAGVSLLSFGKGASVNYTGTPNIGQALTINGQGYTLLYSMSDVEAINGNLSGSYALAKPLDAAGTTYTKAVVGFGGESFSGTFEGLGNKISNLRIDARSVSDIGLFGRTSGIITHVGLESGSVSGRDRVGGLVGWNRGTIAQSYATGAVTTELVTLSSAAIAGGLVGFNSGTITQSYATGLVKGTGGDKTTGVGGVGGLVGLNDKAGVIMQSYATGTVSGSLNVGGLAGQNLGAITDSYATGKISGTLSIGGLIGGNEGRVSRSHASGAISGGASVGGLIGFSRETGFVEDSFATGAVAGVAGEYYRGEGVGGLVGGNLGTIARSYATGEVSGFVGVGGLVGATNGLITRSYATGTVTGTWAIGGLGGNNGGTIADSYATGSVIGVAAFDGSRPETAGGLIGSNSGTLSRTYASGSVSGRLQVGGLVGGNFGTITDSYASGAVSGQLDVGGLVGRSFGDITQSYATGDTSGQAVVGGLVGKNYGFITRTYATGKVTGTTNVGGLVGYNQVIITGSHSPGTVTNSYWDLQTTGQANGLGGSTGGAFDAKGLTTAQFAKTSSFEGWTFGSTAGGNGWVIVDVDGSLNNAGGKAGQTRPFGLWEYSTNIVNAHQLQLIALDPTASYKLAADIDLGPALQNPSQHWFTAANSPYPVSGFVPIGNWGTQFTGTFDGQGHTISNLLIHRPKDSAALATRWASSNVGLFGYVGLGGRIENVGLRGGEVDGFSRVGALAGKSLGTVSNAYATTAVRGVENVGGLVGWSHGTIEESYAAGDVTALETSSWWSYAGGLAGSNGGTIIKSYARGEVTGKSLVGGLAGFNYGDISQSHATGRVRGTGSDIGGLAGENQGMVAHSYATGDVVGSFSVGGLIGANWGSVSQTHATGSVTGQLSVGGLIGLNTRGTDLSYATGSVIGEQSVGGLVGYNIFEPITRSYSTGAVSGEFHVGGLVGDNHAIVSQAYATGAVTGRENVGGLVGHNSGDGRVLQSYATGSVTGQSAVGGLVGHNDFYSWHTGEYPVYSYGRVEGSYASGAVNGTVNVGGLVGINSGTVEQSYATGAASGIIGVGGLVGGNYGIQPELDDFPTATVSQSGAAGVTPFYSPSITRSYATGMVSGERYIGGLAGLSEGDITEAYATGSVSGLSDVGGLVGWNNLGVISASYASGNVGGLVDPISNDPFGDRIGGLVGANDGTIMHSYAMGAVSGASSVGGLAGLNRGVIDTSYAAGPVTGLTHLSYASEIGGLAGTNDGLIIESYATGAVDGMSATLKAGGLVGSNSGAIERSYATGAVSAFGDVGGLIGSNDGLVTRSYATGAVVGGVSVGGLAGSNDAMIAQSYATGDVRGDVDVGGLVGFNSGSVEQSYAMGHVRGDVAVGGLVGSSNGTITETYSTGAVSGTLLVGGLVGSNSGIVASSYWDLQTTGQSQGFGTNTGTFDATGLTTAQFTKTSSFDGWTFDTTPGGYGWVVVNVDSSLNNAGGKAGQTRPFGLWEHSTKIVNAHQLQLIALDPSASYKLAADIDLGSALENPSQHWFTAANSPYPVSGFVPIGNWGTQFTGTFDGQGHTISNLLIHRPIESAALATRWASSNVGLFGYVGLGGRIENVGLLGGEVEGYSRVGTLAGKSLGTISNSYATTAVRGVKNVGGLVGWSHGTIEESYATGPVSGELHVGGLAGQNNGTISWSYATGDVKDPRAGQSIFYNSVGGLVGYNVRGNIFHSYAIGAVGGNSDVGGLVGSNFSGNIFHSYAAGAVGGNSDVGGLVGYNIGIGITVFGNFGLISDSYATGQVTGNSSVGGLVGSNFGAVVQSHATGQVAASTYVGGLIGHNAEDVQQSYATGAVSGNSGVGGLVGGNLGLYWDLEEPFTITYATITQSYATGSVNGERDVGGLVGVNDGTITETYATGSVSGTTNVGGLVGANSVITYTGIVNKSYWDIETTGQSLGFGTNTGTFDAKGLTTAELKSALPAGFDPAVWGIIPGVTYPFLKDLPPPAP